MRGGVCIKREGERFILIKPHIQIEKKKIESVPP